ENLWFAGLCLANASLVCFLFLKTLVESPGLPIVSEPVMNLSGLAWGLFAVRFVYGVFHDRLPRWRLLAGLAAAVAVAAWSLVDTVGALPFVFLFMFASCLEMIRVVVVAIWRRRPGAWLIGCGLLALALGFGVALVRNLGWIPREAIPGGNLIPFGSMVLLIGSMSLYLADAFARANRELRRQLVEVERLSAERLEQERRAQRQETERRLLEAEVRRKSEELEEARALQMSMLPSVVPQRDGLEIATHIAPATEVGGDYYDFAGDDGGLVVAIGDATGHGMRAGTMVTATKALFGLLGRVDLKAELAASNRALKRMNLKRLAMAFTLARFEPGLCRVSAAGMPPVLLRRAASGEVESIELGGTPLGSLPGFPYRQAETATAVGDLVLFMSDGLPELLDPDGEEVGYERVERLLAETAAATAQELVDELVEFAEAWRRERPPDDDLTFVAVRIVAQGNET
ncbi:MAG TPA: SpoIIE family protein phosphatase, partial [Thermoanaerobaculia bacterium]|nr:SpoIIE family protein phosphatase [Thermoanaerobaculia bacterium]